MKKINKTYLKKFILEQKCIPWTLSQRLKRVNISLNANYKSSVLLAGSQRSGTTWIAELMNYDNYYRFMFEPFHPKSVQYWKNRKREIYLRPDSINKEFIHDLSIILSGKIKDKWIDERNKKRIHSKRLIKCVFMNLLIKGIDKNFPGMPKILLLRHPCAVAASRSQLTWNHGVEHYFKQKELVEDYLAPFQSELNNINSKFESYIFNWCIQNYVPLKQFKRGEIHLAFYENFCVNPEKAIDRLFKYLGRSYNNKIFEKLKNPSSTYFGNDKTMDCKSVVGKWKTSLTKDQKIRAMEILHKFGLDKIYSEGIMPDMNGAYRVMEEKEVISGNVN